MPGLESIKVPSMSKITLWKERAIDSAPPGGPGRRHRVAHQVEQLVLVGPQVVTVCGVHFVHEERQRREVVLSVVDADLQKRRIFLNQLAGAERVSPSAPSTSILIVVGTSSPTSSSSGAPVDLDSSRSDPGGGQARRVDPHPRRRAPVATCRPRPALRPPQAATRRRPSASRS